jgi:hypothetical protein
MHGSATTEQEAENLKHEQILTRLESLLHASEAPPAACLCLGIVTNQDYTKLFMP